MIGNISVKTLFIVFVALAIGVFAVWLDKSDNDSSFSRELVTFSFDDVDQFTIVSNTISKTTFQLKDKEWYVSKDGTLFRADQSEVRNLIYALRNISVVRIAATKKSKWADFNMSPNNALHVTVKLNSGTVHDLWLGDYKYQSEDDKNVDTLMLKAERTRLFTNVRVGSDEKVYVVAGALKLAFEKPVDAYRDKLVVNSSVSGWSKLTLEHGPDSSLVLIKHNGRWTINNNPCDSMKMVRYLRTISKIGGDVFFKGSKSDLKAVSYKLTIEGEVMEPIIISCYDYNGEKIINSSTNNEAYFIAGRNSLFSSFFSKIYAVQKGL